VKDITEIRDSSVVVVDVDERQEGISPGKGVCGRNPTSGMQWPACLDFRAVHRHSLTRSIATSWNQREGMCHVITANIG